MKCPRCGRDMVKENPNMVNASYPPSHWMKCACGNRGLLWDSEWEIINHQDNPPDLYDQIFLDVNLQLDKFKDSLDLHCNQRDSLMQLYTTLKRFAVLLELALEELKKVE